MRGRLGGEGKSIWLRIQTFHLIIFQFYLKGNWGVTILLGHSFKVQLIVCLFAKLSLNLTKFQLKLRLRLTLFPVIPATHPPTLKFSGVKFKR